MELRWFVPKMIAFRDPDETHFVKQVSEIGEMKHLLKARNISERFDYHIEGLCRSIFQFFSMLSRAVRNCSAFAYAVYRLPFFRAVARVVQAHLSLFLHAFACAVRHPPFHHIIPLN
jgi:hypothetical protein